MTDNKNIFTNNKKSDNQNVKDNLLIDELDTYSDYVHEFSDSYKNRKEEFLRSLESVNEHKATGKQEDRPKLYILDVKTLKSKASGRVWARQITAQSIGSGKQSNYTITSKNYHEEFQVGVLPIHILK